MGNSQTSSYDEQTKAIKNKIISFELNLYFIGDDIFSLYENMEKEKKQGKGGIISYWNFFYYAENYEEQLEKINNSFIKRLNNFKKDNTQTFKEVIIVKLNKKEENKINEILNIFAKEKDVFCPFIFFLLGEEGNSGKEIESIIPDKEEYEISPLKVFTLLFENNLIESNKILFNHLLRICSYYNELGDSFVVWNKDGKEPISYDLVNSEYPAYINIFCLGKTGCGKSTFLNKFFNEKRSKEGGTGKSTTSKIVKYGIENIPIKIYDIPGFENEETIDIVYKKLNDKTNEMNNDKDKIHLLLYFINIQGETLFYEMEKKILDSIKENNNKIKIIFILTHCSTNPYNSNFNKINKHIKNLIESNIEKIINTITNNFGTNYSIENNYFKKDSIIQDNLILVNLIEDYENDVEEFGFDKVLESIYKTLSVGNSKEDLKVIVEKLLYAISNKIKIDKEYEEKIEEKLKNSYILSQTTFATQREKALNKAEKYYKNMFSFGKTAMVLSPFFREIKLGFMKYQKTKFKKNLKKIFGYNIIDKEDESNNINEKYIEKKEKDKDNIEKEKLWNEVRKEYHKKEVKSGWIIANEIAGYASYALFLGGPVGWCLGSVGLIGTSYISYKQFEKDCTEYYEQYKKHFEENKYSSFINFIITIFIGIKYFEAYIDNLKQKNKTNLSISPNSYEIIKEIKENIIDIIKIIEKNSNMNNRCNDILNSIPVLFEDKKDF